MSDLSESLTVAHMSWATSAIRSWLLISPEWPEGFAHGRSFVMSDLSKSLTVADLIWAKWANERMSDERWSKFPARNIRNENLIKGTKIEQKIRKSNKRYENRKEGTQIKGKYAKQRKETFFSVSRNNSKHFFLSYFRIFFSFAKRSKLPETVTCFVQLRISRN